MFARATSCMLASKPGASSSLNSEIFPRAWMAMKTKMASTASTEDSFTVCAIHSWIQAHDCLERGSFPDWLRMKASCWFESSQNTDSMAPKVWPCCTETFSRKYSSSGKIHLMRDWKFSSEMLFASTSAANWCACFDRFLSTSGFVTGIQSFGMTLASSSCRRSSSKDMSWKATDPMNSLAKSVSFPRWMVIRFFWLPWNSCSAYS
mmetsp:Transcript_16413/g.43391  ORF Transcript_16413/g.43391 Transcript_16413/m.43391 type:complete len:206 (-) Transcript_16413:437-1054(-)